MLPDFTNPPKPKSPEPMLNRTVEQFLDECEQVFRERLWNPAATIPQPMTAAELDAFCDRWPERAHLVRPADCWILESVGLSLNTGRPVEPLPVELREQIVATVADDPSFVATLARLLESAKGGAEWA